MRVDNNDIVVNARYWTREQSPITLGAETDRVANIMCLRRRRRRY